MSTENCPHCNLPPITDFVALRTLTKKWYTFCDNGCCEVQPMTWGCNTKEGAEKSWNKYVKEWGGK